MRCYRYDIEQMKILYRYIGDVTSISWRKDIDQSYQYKYISSDDDENIDIHELYYRHRHKYGRL